MGLQAVVMFSSSLAFIYTGYPKTLANTFLTYVLVLYIVIVKLLLQLHQVRVDTCLQHNRGRTIMKIDMVKTRTDGGGQPNQVRPGAYFHIYLPWHCHGNCHREAYGQQLTSLRLPSPWAVCGVNSLLRILVLPCLPFPLKCQVSATKCFQLRALGFWE